MSALPKHVLPSAGHPAIERAAETRSRFFEGEMFGVVETTKNHARIVGILGGDDCLTEIREWLGFPTVSKSFDAGKSPMESAA